MSDTPGHYGRYPTELPRVTVPDRVAPLAPVVPLPEVERRVAAAVAAERERCAQIADMATTGLTGFVESDRVEFAVRNMAKLRETIAARIRETP